MPHVNRIRILLLCGLAALCARGFAQAGIDTVWDGMAHYAATIVATQGTTECKRYSRAEGVMRPALFMHPNVESPAHMQFAVQLPTCVPGERLVLAGYAGLSDGIGDRPIDGVGLGIAVNGQRLLHQAVRTSSWVPVCVDLAPWAGQRITLTLSANDGGAGNLNADWALFGEPRILRLRGNEFSNNVTRVLAGGLLLDITGGVAGATVQLAPLAADRTAAGPSLVMPLAIAAGAWYIDFDFSYLTNADTVLIAMSNAWLRAARVAPLPSACELVAFGPDRSALFAGEPYALCATVKNTGKGLARNLRLVCNTLTQTVARINPGQQVVVAWPMPAHDPAGERNLLQSTLNVVWPPDSAGPPRFRRLGQKRSLKGDVHVSNNRIAWLAGGCRRDGGATRSARVPRALLRSESPDLGPPRTLTTNCVYQVWPALPNLPGTIATNAEARALNNDWHLLQTPHLRVLTCASGAGPLCFYAAAGTSYVRVATAPALAELCLGVTPEVLPRGSVRVGEKASLQFGFPVAGAAGRLQVALAPDRVPGSLRVTLRLDARRDLSLRAVRGPAVMVGDGTTGARKNCALFPGLEYLDRDEPSSSTRNFTPELALRLVPDPYEVSVPLMAVETSDALVALLWDQRQQWAPGHTTLSALFASPNFLDQRANHRLQLFVPADTNLVPKNATMAAQPFALKAGQSVAFSQTLLLRHHAHVLDALDAWVALVPGTFPPAAQWPRSLSEEIALSRQAFMHTLWDAARQQSYQMVGNPSANLPDVAALLNIDSLLTGDTNARARAALIFARTVATADPDALAHAGGHILRMSIPFIYGHLDEAWPAYRAMATRVMDTIGVDGSWAYYPAPHCRMLGEPGTKTLGVSGWWCLVLWHWARMTGDPRAIRVGRDALAHLDTYRVPTGASGWEVPLAAPDILAVVFATRAFVSAYEVTGERYYLDRAIHWARTGLPFIYLWDDPAKPGMRYAALACFGTTFFTHSWLGVAVQWEGLVYADALLALARHDQSHPWRRIADGILASALYQQVDARDGMPALIGTYPDSWGQRFTRKIPAFLSPEGIMGVLYQLQDIPLHPDTAIVHVNGAPVHITAGGAITHAVASNAVVTFALTWLRGGTTCAAVPFIARPAAVLVDGAPARMGADLDAPGVQARYDDQARTLFLRLKHRGRPVRVTVRGVQRLSQPNSTDPSDPSNHNL